MLLISNISATQTLFCEL